MVGFSCYAAGSEVELRVRAAREMLSAADSVLGTRRKVELWEPTKGKRLLEQKLHVGSKYQAGTVPFCVEMIGPDILAEAEKKSLLQFQIRMDMYENRSSQG